MSFSTKDVKETTTQRTSPKFNVGYNQAKIESIEIKTSANGKKQLKFHVYGPPITEDGFKPWLKSDKITPYHGQCGIVQTNYVDVNDEEAFTKLVQRSIAPLATAFGVKAQIDAINAGTFEEFVQQIEAIFSNADLPYVWMNFSGEEYERPGSAYPGYSLSLRGVALNEEQKDKYPAGLMKKLAPKVEAETDDLPF